MQAQVRVYVAHVLSGQVDLSLSITTEDTLMLQTPTVDTECIPGSRALLCMHLALTLTPVPCNKCDRPE